MDTIIEQTLARWESTIAREEVTDPLWRVHAYRVARCLLDQANSDAERLAPSADAKTIGQLVRAVGSIGANVAEGYSRRTGGDRSRFYGYALGSARESMVWYRSVAQAMDADALAIRMAFLVQERRLLIGMLKAVQRDGGPSFERG
jgi:four helix bundle protein